jgi:hypothetical protein
MQLTKKIRELGQSANAKKNSSEANSSAIEPTRTKAERDQLIEQLITESETEEKQKHKDKEDVENYHTEFYTCGTAELEPV